MILFIKIDAGKTKVFFYTGNFEEIFIVRKMNQMPAAINS